MRTIKFRAWFKQDKRMVEVIEIDFSKGTILTSMKAKKKGLNDFELMQFTGLKDKNGKEIYEGDIVGRISVRKDPYYKKSKVTITKKFVVKWKNGGFNIRGGNCKILGSIYENKDLLKGGDDKDA